jgi:hypothetical protein
MSLSNNYSITMTELKTYGLPLIGSAPADSNKIVTRGDVDAYYYVRSVAPYNTYSSNRCPMYQDILKPQQTISIALTISSGLVGYLQVYTGSSGLVATLSTNGATTSFTLNYGDTFYCICQLTSGSSTTGKGPQISTLANSIETENIFKTTGTLPRTITSATTTIAYNVNYQVNGNIGFPV